MQVLCYDLCKILNKRVFKGLYFSFDQVQDVEVAKGGWFLALMNSLK